MGISPLQNLLFGQPGERQLIANAPHRVEELGKRCPAWQSPVAVPESRVNCSPRFAGRVMDGTGIIQRPFPGSLAVLVRP